MSKHRNKGYEEEGRDSDTPQPNKLRPHHDLSQSQNTGHGAPSQPRQFSIKATGAEAAAYDFVAARPPNKTTNVLESIGHLVKSCLGGGVVAIHESYMQCGLFSAVLLNVFLGIFVSYCMLLLAKSAQKMYGRIKEPQLSFPDLAEASLAVGPWPSLKKYSKCFRYAVDFTIGVDLFGSCCVYQVIISRTIKQLVDGTEQITDDNGIPIRVWISCLLVPCILICMITSLKYLAPFSLVADFFIVLVAISTIVYGLQAATRSAADFPIYKSVAGLFEFIGVCVFSMEGVGVTLAIENHMTEPKKFPLVLFGGTWYFTGGRTFMWGFVWMGTTACPISAAKQQCSDFAVFRFEGEGSERNYWCIRGLTYTSGMSVVVGIVMTIGFFGYYGFGEKAKSPVTMNFPMSGFPLALKVFMALMIYVTFALNFWIPFDLVWYYLKRRHPPSSYWLWERVYRAAAVIIITIIAITFPNVSKFMGFLGSFCLSNMGFIFPALIDLSIHWTDPGLGFMKWRLIKFIAILIFGLIVLCLGTYNNVKELIKESF